MDIKEIIESEFGLIVHHVIALGQGLDSIAYLVNGEYICIKLLIHMGSEEETLYALSVLAEGGTVLQPLQPHPEPDDGGCGSLAKDRLGYTWIITCPNPAKQ